MLTNMKIGNKVLAIAVLLFGILISLSIVQVQAATSDSAVSFKKDPSTDLFTLTIKDPDGLQEFSLTPASKSSYGGGLSGCPKTFSINNVSFTDPADFEPVMSAYVIDCKNNTTELEILPPKDGLAVSRVIKKAESLPPPPPSPVEEKKEKPAGTPLSAEDIRYPVPELGGCQNEAECKSYCDNAQNAKACLTFAKKYNLISEKEAEEVTDKFLNVKNGPGGCNSGASCETYCNNVDHLDECISFAEETGYYSGDELAEARKFQSLIKSGKQFPGGCKDRNTCELYCSQADHMDECIAFAEESGFMSQEELAEAKKFLPLMKSGETPGGCRSKEQCENYCSDESRLEECIAFADKAGLLSAEEKEMIKKTGGKGPGNCRSKAQCEAYCEANQEECFNWATENGLMSEADLEKMREGMGRFREELDKMPPEVVQCLKNNLGEESFNKIVNGQPIFDRGMEGKMKSCFSQLTSQLSGQLNTLPPEASQCIKDTIGEEGLQKLQSGEFDQDVDFSSLEGCFQQLQASFGHGHGGPGGPAGSSGGFSGPGGCSSIDECTAYCQTHPQECQQFAPPGGGFPGGGATDGQFPGSGATGGEFPGGRPAAGGCKTKEECVAYCQTHPGECGGFVPPSSGTPSGSATQQPYSGHTAPADSQLVCDPGWIPAVNPQTGLKYCAITQEKCGPGAVIAQDQSGYNICRPSDSSSGTSEQYQQQYQQTYQQQYQQQSAPQTSPTNIPTGFPTSPEEYCKQYPEQCQRIQQEYAPQPTSYYPSLGEFLLGLVVGLLQ